MNHCTCLVVGAQCMVKWLPSFALLHRKSGNAYCNHFFFFRKIVDMLYRADPPPRSSGTLLLTFADVWDN